MYLFEAIYAWPYDGGESGDGGDGDDSEDGDENNKKKVVMVMTTATVFPSTLSIRAAHAT